MSSIQLVVKENNFQWCEINIAGELTKETAVQFMNELPMVKYQPNVILSCKGLTLIDGTGLVALSVFLTHISNQGCGLRITGLSDQPLRLFKYLGLYDIYCELPTLNFKGSFKLSAWFKRLADIVLSVIMLTVFLIPGLILCGLIMLESPGSPIFTQTRVKNHYRDSYGILKKSDELDMFKMIKFRTMCKDADKETGAVTAIENDPRVTRLGKILRKVRLDELPNFINVLKGDMSVIGPRPDQLKILQDAAQIFPLVFERLRFVKPGITGYAQLELKSNGSLLSETEGLVNVIAEQDRGQPALEYRFKLYYEATYILTMNSFFRFLWLELSILVRTPWTMFVRHNVI